MKTGISEESFKSAARELQCEIELIKAVDAKESRGGFFLKWRCKILLNLISWKYLRSAGIKPILSNICYPVWELSLTEKKASSTQSFKSGFDK
jgi:hypothetical protein